MLQGFISFIIKKKTIQEEIMAKIIPSWELDRANDRATITFTEETEDKQVLRIDFDYKTGNVITMGDIKQVVQSDDSNSIEYFKQSLYSYGRTLF